ncbi:MAG TPA: glycosyltransferase family 39 protein, partial [Propionibacteriaceae bacterium]|nr:glycosyltransferase family 39 protein [Propionibacteriaceae bacterium]
MGTLVPRRASGRLLGALVVLIFCSVWVIVNGIWLTQHRAGQLMNIDETGYLGIALNYSYAWERGGFLEWVHALLTPSQHAPVTMAVASIPFLWIHRPMFVAFAVILAFAALVLVLTAAYAVLLGNRWVLVTALALVATAPGFISLSRNFTFAVPATAVTILALYSLARSRGLLSVPWSVLLGVSVGLMPLTRTMMIAFVPVVLVAAALHAVGHRERLRRRFVNLVIATAIAATVTGVWLI